MSLIDDVRDALHVSSKKTDGEISAWIDAARADMLRVGVDPILLGSSDGSGIDPLARSAVYLYVKANYGFDNDEAGRFLASYERVLTDLRNEGAE